VVKVKTVLFAILITAFLFGSTVMAQSPLDGFDVNVMKRVAYASAILNDCKLLMGGSFSSVGGVTRTNVARLTNDNYAVSELTVSRDSVSVNESLFDVDFVPVGGNLNR